MHRDSNTRSNTVTPTARSDMPRSSLADDSDNQVSPHEHNKNGRALLVKLQRHRQNAVAKREGSCANCGIKTHEVTLSRMGQRKRDPLTNENVHDGVCIDCNYRSGPRRLVDGHVFVELPTLDSKGRLLPMEQYQALAEREGCCLWCGIRTHKVTVTLMRRTRDPLTNDEVYEGACIKCNLWKVPRQVGEDWACNTDNPRVSSKAAVRRIPDRLKSDRDHMLKVCSRNGFGLEKASPDLRDDKQVVLAAVSHTGSMIRFASPRLRKDKEVFLRAHQNSSIPLDMAPIELRNDKDVVLAACCHKDGGNVDQFRFASESLRSDKEVVLEVCAHGGNTLQFASEKLRADKDVVMASVKSQPESLKFALEGLNQDKDCLIAAGLWDKDYEKAKVDSKDIVESTKLAPKKEMKPYKKRKIVLSTKFSLAQESSPHATKFTVELKKHAYITENFVVYSPNAFNKGTCDPNWTDNSWPCRGTYETCQKPSHLKTGRPQEADCCWRYSFRYHLRDAFRRGGLMIQVVDKNEEGRPTLGDGQRIEHEMAPAVGIKTFCFREPATDSDLHPPSYADRVSKLVTEIQEWSSAQDRAICPESRPGIGIKRDERRRHWSWFSN